jgi:AraC-like DNA-binding protein
VDAFEGDIVCMNPGDVHDGKPLGGPSRRWFTIYIEQDVFGALAGRPDVAFTRPAFRDARLRDAVKLVLRSMQGGEPLEFEEALVAACGLMLRDHSTLAVRDDRADADLDRVRERLADSPADAPTLGELASLAGLGKFQLLRRFRKRFGATPHDWLVQRRAERARALIRDGIALPEAAAAAGFADQSHMTRVFVQRFGFTPGAWRAGAISFKTRR